MRINIVFSLMSLCCFFSAYAQTELVKQGVRFPDNTIQATVIDTGQALGDMMYWDGSRWQRIPDGIEGQILVISCDGLPVWADTMPFSCGCPITDIDGNKYNTVKIGTQCWTKENVKVTRYGNGDTIPNMTDSTAWSLLTTGAWCYMNNDPSYDTLSGKLYNWFAAADTRNICPDGWHVSTDAEWDTLLNYLGGWTVAGNKLKEAGPAHWGASNNSDNSSGFTALPGDGRNYDGAFQGIGEDAYFNTSSEDTTNGSGLFYSMHSGLSVVLRYQFYKESGNSCRCVQD